MKKREFTVSNVAQAIKSLHPKIQKIRHSTTVHGITVPASASKDMVAVVEDLNDTATSAGCIITTAEMKPFVSKNLQGLFLVKPEQLEEAEFLVRDALIAWRTSHQAV